MFSSVYASFCYHLKNCGDTTANPICSKSVSLALNDYPDSFSHLSVRDT